MVVGDHHFRGVVEIHDDSVPRDRVPHLEALLERERFSGRGCVRVTDELLHHGGHITVRDLVLRTHLRGDALGRDRHRLTEATSLRCSANTVALVEERREDGHVLGPCCRMLVRAVRVIFETCREMSSRTRSGS